MLDLLLGVIIDALVLGVESLELADPLGVEPGGAGIDEDDAPMAELRRAATLPTPESLRATGDLETEDKTLRTIVFLMNSPWLGAQVK